MFYLRDPTSDVSVEIEILLDGRHQDQLTHKSVVWRCGCEVCLKHLNKIQIFIIRLGLSSFVLLRRRLHH